MWIDISASSDFSIHNLPYGIFSLQKEGTKKVGVALGSWVIDMTALAQLGAFNHLSFDKTVFEKPTLNDFIAIGKPLHIEIRKQLQQIFTDDNSPLKAQQNAFLIPQSQVIMHMPIAVSEYTDFYSSEPHATNVGKMFRDPANALLPNWKHLPVGYHGRASSIHVSGVNFHRPKGQTRPNDAEPPVFGPTKALDIELEVATIIGKGNAVGDAISADEAPNHVFGFVLFNDWSARDMQRWEYVPLGPFLAKNFFSSISPWVVTLEALAPFKIPAPQQEPTVLPYLQEKERYNFDVQLEVLLQPAGSDTTTTVAVSNFKYLYWTVAQQIAHHTVNGCNLNLADVLASGTISGTEPNSFGSFLELTWGGKNPLQLPNGITRKFVEDNDTVTIKGFAQKGDIRVGFGEVKTTILPAK